MELIDSKPLHLSRCPTCPYPDKNDKERALLKFINPENNTKVYAVKCPNIIKPDGEPCINYKFMAGTKLNVKAQTREIPANANITQKLTKKILEELYINQEKSLQDIANEYNCTRQMIKHLMDRYSLTRRKRSHARVLAIKHKKIEGFEHDNIDESFFKSWSPGMAWVLGLIFTDGNLQNTPSRGLRVSIHSIDLEMLEKVRSLLKSSRKITKRQQSYDKSKHIYNFDFYRAEMRKDLVSFGLTERKSLTMEFPNVPDAFKRHFIRGCWDGDGSVFISQGRLRASYVCGSKAFIQKLVDELYKAGIHRQKIFMTTSEALDSTKNLRAKYPTHHYPLKIHVDNRLKAPSYSIKIDSRENLIKLYNYFYDGVDESMFLRRKFFVFVKGLNLAEKDIKSLFKSFTMKGIIK